MPGTITPRDVAQLRDAIAWAAAEEAPLELRAGGSRRALGRPVEARHVLDLSAFSGIVSYEPEELLLVAGAATPMAEVSAALAARGQMLAFEPPDTGLMLGGAAGAGTIGGAIATGLSGPRRVKAGAARDHLLAFAAVSGRGESFKAGGKVVKNVTGYDLPKILCGSHGTLAAMTEVTVKVLPAPPRARTVLLFGLDVAAGTRAMADALNSPFEVSGAAMLPAAAAARSGVDFVRDAGETVVALRIEGTPASVAARCEGLRRLLAGRARDEELHSMRSRRLWEELRDVAALLPADAAALWRVSVPPAAAPALCRDLPGAFFLDWGGGLAWLAAAPGAPDAHAARLRAAIAGCGGHATLVRAPDTVRAAVPVFQPPAPALERLSARVKDGFDPRRVLNRGRMHAGM
ncbi:MAG: glycolate oxidase subunit GlcE [Alphaproteobacteria bacterium]|nr:glycolate oxidase subunit GlcE [Alphaproteobacteria bacterium]